MSNETSPRPWQVIKMHGLDEDDVCVYVADANNSSIALMVAPAENDAENAQLIVDAVNEQEEHHKQLAEAAAEASSYLEERDHLRKQVAAYLLELVKRSSINEALGEALKRICDICGEAWDAPERDREAAMSKALNDIYELARGSRKEAAK